MAEVFLYRKLVEERRAPEWIRKVKNSVKIAIFTLFLSLTLIKETVPMEKKALILLVSLILALTTIYTQIQVHRLKFLRTAQLQRHRDVLENRARNPWQYRVLSEWLVEAVIRGSKLAGITSPVFPFVAFRVLQNLVIFLLAATLYHRLGLKPAGVLIGLLLLAWGMSYAFRDSDLEFSTYSDIIFYLVGALIIISHGNWWLPVLTFFAALNRETAALIPFAFLFYRIEQKCLKRTSLVVFCLSMAAYLSVFFGLRFIFGWRPLAGAWGHRPGFDMLVFNLKHTLTWAKLMWTLNVLPVLCVFSFRSWPRSLKCMCLSLLPIWFAFHFFYLFIPEVRMVLVPLALVFVPGALMMDGYQKENEGITKSNDGKK